MASNDHYWRNPPSATDRLWADSFTQVSADREFMRAAAADEGEYVYYICKRYSISRDKRYTAIFAAAEAGASNTVAALLDSNNFDLTESSGADKTAAQQLLGLAAERKDVAMMRALIAHDKGNEFIPEGKIIDAYIKADWMEGFEAQFSNLTKGQNGLYRAALVAAASVSDEWVRRVLSYTHKFTDVQDALDRALIEAAVSDSLSRAEMLLREGANPNYSDGRSFTKAAEARNISMVKAMVANGLALETYGESVLKQCKKLKAQSPIIEYLEAELPKIVTKVVVKKQEDTRYSIGAKSVLKDVLNLHEGPKLTTLFNFETRQQIVIIETKSNMTTTVTGFDLLDPGVIEHAEKQLIRLDGDPCGPSRPGQKINRNLPGNRS